jgi:tetratricopeptide (TPR) repeat protein
LAEINRAITIAPNNADNLNSRAWIFLVSGQATEAEIDARQAVRLDPENLDNIENLGRALFHLERYEDAMKNFERVANALPDYEYLWADLAMTYGYLGRIEEARAAVRKRNVLARNVPDLTLQGHESWWTGQYSYDLAYLDQMVQGLSLAGVPSGAIDEPTEVNYKDLVTKSAGTFDVAGAIEIDASGAKTLHDRGVAFIDSRGSSFYGRGHIPGATNLLFPRQLTIDSLSQLVGLDDEVVFYCDGPNCQLSPNSCAKALTWGYTRVYYFAGGFPEWRSAGYPVEIP